MLAPLLCRRRTVVRRVRSRDDQLFDETIIELRHRLREEDGALLDLILLFIQTRNDEDEPWRP